MKPFSCSISYWLGDMESFPFWAYCSYVEGGILRCGGFRGDEQMPMKREMWKAVGAWLRVEDAKELSYKIVWKQVRYVLVMDLIQNEIQGSIYIPSVSP